MANKNESSEKKIETETFIKRLINATRMDSRIDESNEQSEIGQMYNRLVYTVTKDGLKILNEIDIDDVIGLLGHIDYIFNENEICENNINELTENIDTYINTRNIVTNNGWFLFVRCGQSSVVSNYLKNHCNEITDKELFCYDKAHNMITVCNDAWLMSHFKFILKVIKKLEHLKYSILSKGNTEQMEQYKKEKQKEAKKEYASERCECDCSMWYNRSNKIRHENTKYHKEWLEEGSPYREEGPDPDTLTEEERKKLHELKMDEHIDCECGNGYARKDKHHHMTTSFHRGFCKAVKEQM